MYRFPAIAKLDGFRKLSAREIQVILLSSEGSTDVEVARQLKLAPESVSRVWTRVKKKLGLGSRIPAMALFSSAIARLNERLSFEPLIYTGVPSVMGGFFDVAMLVSPGGTILSCSIGMS